MTLTKKNIYDIEKAINNNCRYITQYFHCKYLIVINNSHIYDTIIQINIVSVKQYIYKNIDSYQ